MGKRRSRKAAPKKAVQKLPSTFDCPFCNHNSTVVVKMGRTSQIGKLECRVCGVKAETRITHLSKEIDVYCEWMDTCVELNKQGDENSTVDDGNYKRRRMADAVTRLLEDEGSEGDSEADLVQPAEVVSADDDGD